MEAGVYWLLRITTFCASTCGAYPPLPAQCGDKCGVGESFYERTYDTLADQEAGKESHRTIYASLAACNKAKVKWQGPTPDGHQVIKVLSCAKLHVNFCEDGAC